MKIYTGPDYNLLLADKRKIDLILYHEKDKWEFVNSIDDADIIPMLRPPYSFQDKIVTVSDQLNFLNDHINSKWLLLLMHTHLTEGMSTGSIEYYQNEYPTKKLLVTTVNQQPINDRHIPINFQKNLVKIMYTKRHEYDEHELFYTRLWFQNLTKESFRYREIVPFSPIKKFLTPNIVRLPPDSESYLFKMTARRTLAERLDKEQSYYSDVHEGVYLMSEEKRLFKTYEGTKTAGFTPISTNYYRDSLISVYVETIGKGPCRLLSEKTYLPLFNGHYILPFGYAGLIQDIKNEGFRLPEWIDYSYDLIENDEKRLSRWLQVYDYLRHQSLEELTVIANRDLDILKHNRNLFFQQPIDSLYDKVKLATGL